MARPTDHECRAALVDALALLDQAGQDGAACYVAMAIDCLDQERGQSGSTAVDPDPFRVAGGRRPD